MFNAKTAQELLTKPGETTQLLVRAKPGVSQEQLAKSLKTALAGETASGNAPLDVVTGDALAKETQSAVNTIFGFINTFFSAFAFIALFVSIFVISNSFSILVKQRTRENAMLRTLGASSKQILATTFGEALAVGVTILGLIAVVLGWRSSRRRTRRRRSAGTAAGSDASSATASSATGSRGDGGPTGPPQVNLEALALESTSRLSP